MGDESNDVGDCGAGGGKGDDDDWDSDNDVGVVNDDGADNSRTITSRWFSFARFDKVPSLRFMMDEIVGATGEDAR